MNYIEKVSQYFNTPVSFELDDKIHRFGKKKEFWAIGKKWIYQNNEYYQIKYGNFKDAGAQVHTINSWDGQDLTKGESTSIRQRIKTINVQVDAEKQEKYKKCRDVWGPIFKTLPVESELHEYCKHKGLDSNFTAKISDATIKEIHLYPGTLCIPVYNVNKQLTGVQRIYKKKDVFEKRYSTGLELKGSVCPLSSFKDAPLVYLCEGFATGASVQMATETPTIICFQANNIQASIETIREINPACKIIICADRDLHPDDPLVHKIGEKKAKYAAKKFNDCMVKLVEFPEGSPDHWSDFNDAHNFVSLDYIKKQLTINEDKFEEEGFAKDIKNKFVFYDDNDKMQWDYHRLKAYFEKIHHYRYLCDIDKVIAWNGTHYEFLEDQQIKAFAEEHFPDMALEKQRREFLGLIKACNLASEDFFHYKNIEGLINLKNGVYDFVNNKMLPHSPSFHFQHVIPIDYDADANCPHWEDLMCNVVCQRKHLHDAVEEFMGFCISNMDYTKFNQSLIFDGSGSNGKSTIIRAIQELCGVQNSSSISIAETATNRFLLGSMAHKLVNFSEEEPKKLFAETGQFKKMTGGSPIFAEKKGKQGYQTENRTKLIMSYNEMPYLPDASVGMRRRLLIIPFDLNFEKNPGMKKLRIKEKLSDEMSGILNNAIAGLRRLIANGKFTEVPESDRKINEMINSSDSVRSWFDEEIIYTKDPNDKKFTDSLYASYSNYLGTNNPRTSKARFMKKIKLIFQERGYNYENKTSTIDGLNGRAVVRIKLRLT